MDRKGRTVRLTYPDGTLTEASTFLGPAGRNVGKELWESAKDSEPDAEIDDNFDSMLEELRLAVTQALAIEEAKNESETV